MLSDTVEREQQENRLWQLMPCQKCHQWRGENSLKHNSKIHRLWEGTVYLQSSISKWDSACMWHKDGMCLHVCCLQWLCCNVFLIVRNKRKRRNLWKLQLWVCKPKLCLCSFLPHQPWRFCRESWVGANAGKPKLRAAPFSGTPWALQHWQG